MKLNVKVIVFFVFASLFSGQLAARGLDRDVRQYFDRCEYANSTLEISNCLGKQYAKADAELNEVWRQVLSMISGRNGMPGNIRNDWRQNIIAGQRAWVKYKEAECRGSAPYKYWQGTLASVESLGCFLRLTIVRTSDLKNYLGQ